MATVAVLAAGGMIAQQAPEEGAVIRNPEVSAPVSPFVFDGDVRNLPSPPQWRPGDPMKEIPRRFYPAPDRVHHHQVIVNRFRDPLYEAQLLALDNTSGAFTEPSRNFPGQVYMGVSPPDTIGDVSLTHYIQMVNSIDSSVVRIYDKEKPVPNELATFALDSLGGGICATGWGDPIVLYDRLAERWLLAEFSLGGNRLCVYISRTDDPLSGGWFNYGFQAPEFPDYPKYGVWPTDANGGPGSYVVTTNEFVRTGVYALDRGAMLSGAAGFYQRLEVLGLSGFLFEPATPADLDGPTPPAPTTPAIIIRHRDTEVHNGPSAPGDLLDMWAFNVDWLNPSNTTLEQLPSIDIGEFDSTLCGLTSDSCFPQPGSVITLDPLREVIMYRVQYMNHGDHETLAGNFVTDVDGNDHGGIRWFELRRVGGGEWTLYQEGTYAIDSDHRWMAATAMDQDGNLAMGYSVSSEGTYPSLRYTGRYSSDPLGVMTQAETPIHDGSQHSITNRWGDYAGMTLDPEDDCTFWFTSLDNTIAIWRTQIASFAFDSCGCQLEPPPPTASAIPVGDNRIDVAWDDSSVASVVEYRVRRGLAPGGPYETIAVVADTSPGIADGPGYVFEDRSVSGGLTYYYVIVSSDGVACSSENSNEVSATAEGACALSPTFDGLESVSAPYMSTCALDLAWNAASANCAGPIGYNIYRSETGGFTPGPTNLLSGEYPGTSYTDVFELVNNTPYYYIVRAADLTAGVEDANTMEIAGVPGGELTNGTWFDDAGDSDVAKLSMRAPWSLNSSEGHSGPAVYKTGSYSGNLCSDLTTPPLLLGGASTLSFWSHYSLETSWDKGEAQISFDDGLSWQRFEVDYPGTSTNYADGCHLPVGDYFTGLGTAYEMYTGDVSYNGPVRFRFLLSTDSGISGDGWWIDDIAVTNVNYPGTCTTGSSCADNPYANVLPEGPLALCEGTEQTLTVELTEGVGPYTYQWTRDGLEIPGATSSLLTVNDTGAHAYNAKVKAATCEDEVYDGNDTSITWTMAPLFDGIESAENAAQDDCTIDLSWEPASTVCGGPVRYSVYRDTTIPVPIVPANRIVSGLVGTSFSDSDQLDHGTMYHYVVRAVEGTTGQEDANTRTRSAVPTGPSGESDTCQTGWAHPLPAPDGTNGTSPLAGSRVTPSGDVIEVSWDVEACTATKYNLIYGWLSDVATYHLSGSKCALGTSGEYTWNSVPDGDLYFLVVGTNGHGVESSWGTDGHGNERNGETASGQCLVFEKSTEVPCP